MFGVAPGLVASLVVFAFVGLALVRDIGGITTRMETGATKWWSGGPIRRRIGLRSSYHYRALGYALLAVDLVVIAALIVTH